ncbi:uncharacterized protein LOC143238528 [Tachypleus tridentatus]|uniref:uncharacterized protein LOC143238528 n=1 Tax=Tachypleus tridentatus TaxID=6853 RepID=UPI003FCF632F
MKNRALLATYIFLVCCICYSGLQISIWLIYLCCDQNATNKTRVTSYECLLNSSSVIERNVIGLCQNQTAPSLSNVEFLNKICNNVTSRFQIEICVRKYLVSVLIYFYAT